MKIDKGGILICSKCDNAIEIRYTDKIIIGYKYEVLHDFDLSTSTLNNNAEQYINVKHLKSGSVLMFASYKYFITLKCYRDFKLRQVLDDKS